MYERDQFGVFDDFLADQSDTFFIDTIADSGSVTVGDAVGGIIALVPSDGTVADNDEAYLRSANEIFKFAAGKPALAVASLKFTEANTDDANVMFGFMDAVGADSILDNGAGPKASFDGAVIYKVDGETTWRVQTSRGTTKTTTQTNHTAGGSSYQELSIEVIDFDPLNCEVVFRLNGNIMVDTNNRPIVHRMAYASNTEMNVFVGVKNGDTNLETLNVDYLGAWQVR